MNNGRLLLQLEVYSLSRGAEINHAAPTGPQVFSGVDADGNRLEIDGKFGDYKWKEHYYLTGSSRSLLRAVATGDASELWVSGHDMRQALEVAVACDLSADRGSVDIALPLPDRTAALYPTPGRWSGR